MKSRHVRSSCRRSRLARMLRSRHPAVFPAIWMEIRLRRFRHRHPGALVRPSVLAAGHRPRRVPLGRSNRLRWQVHLAGWLFAAVPAVLLGGWPWLAVAPVAFEALLLAATLRVIRPALLGGGPTEGPWGAGDREPRRPLPVAGSGAAAMPFPDQYRDVRSA